MQGVQILPRSVICIRPALNPIDCLQIADSRSQRLLMSSLRRNSELAGTPQAKECIQNKRPVWSKRGRPLEGLLKVWRIDRSPFDLSSGTRMSTSAPVKPTTDGLPIEILRQIFLAVVSPRQGLPRAGDLLVFGDLIVSEDLSAPVVLSHVCRDWREWAIGDAMLWTDIQVSLRSIQRTRRYIERSAPLGIDLIINSVDEEQLWTGERLWKMLNGAEKGVMQRVRSAVVQSSDMGESFEILSLFSDYGRLPAITSLQLSVARGCITPLNTLLPDSLTTLEIHDQELSPAEFRDILEGCPQLSTLVLTDSKEIDDYGIPAPWNAHTPGIQPSATPILAPSLKSLAVCLHKFPVPSHGCSTTCLCPFRDLFADNLEYLELADRHTHNHLLPLIKRRCSEFPLFTHQSHLATPAYPSTRLRPPLVLALNELYSDPSTVTDAKVADIPRNLHLHFILPPSELAFGLGFNPEFRSTTIHAMSGPMDPEDDDFVSVGKGRGMESWLWRSSPDFDEVRNALHVERLTGIHPGLDAGWPFSVNGRAPLIEFDGLENWEYGGSYSDNEYYEYHNGEYYSHLDL